MDQAQLERIPLIRLEGIREITRERGPCSIILEFLADNDTSQPDCASPILPHPRIVPIRIAEFVQIVAHLQNEGAIPELPWDWIHQMGNDHGLALHSPPEPNTEPADHS